MKHFSPMDMDNLSGQIYDRKLYRFLFRYLRPYMKLVILSFVFLLFVAALELAVPLITMKAVDDFIVSDITLARFDNPSELEDFLRKATQAGADELETFETEQGLIVSLPMKERRYLTPDLLNPVISRVALIPDGQAIPEAIQSLDDNAIYPMGNRRVIHLDHLPAGMLPDSLYQNWNDQGWIQPERYVFVDNNSENQSTLSADHQGRTLFQDGIPRITLSPEIIAVSDYRLEALKKNGGWTSENLVELRSRSSRQLYRFGLYFLAAVVLLFGFNFLQIYIINYAAQHAMYDLRRDLFRHLTTMPVRFFDTNPVGRLVTRVTNDIRTIDETLSAGIIQLAQDILILIGIITIMLVLHWKLALAAFTILPLTVYHMAMFKKKTRIIYRDIRQRLAVLNATLSEDIAGSRIIKLFNRFGTKMKDFAAMNKKYFDAGIDQTRLFARFRPMIFIMRFIALAIVLWYGGSMILRGALTLGLLIAFMRYMDRFFEPINQISEKFNILQAAMSGAERIWDLMQKEPEDYRHTNHNKIRLRGEIEFRNVWLSYAGNDEYALKDISFKATPGEKIALVGHTGSGKTSTINIMTNLYPIQKGEILLDGKPLHSYSVGDIRANIGIVQQDVFLFAGRIRENITLNNPDISDQRMIEVARYVNVHPFIDRLEGKYDEPVTERGATFSVGQRQLIAFARVLAYNPAIFVLDEATSNIDTETEIMIQDALQKVMKGRTSIIIAHRLSTIKNVDRILVLHKGRIVEEGSHETLLAKQGLYWDLYRLQFEQNG